MNRWKLTTDRVPVPGDTLPTWTGGAGRTAALVVHGGPDLGGTYLHRPLLETLGDLLRLVFYDQRGTVRAPPATGLGSSDQAVLECLVGDLDEVRRHHGLASPILIGHSFGGLLCLEYARRFPTHASALLLIDPDPLVRRDWEVGRAAVEERRSATDADWLSSEGPTCRVADPEAFYRVALRPYFVDPTVADELELALREDPARRPRPTGRAIRAELGDWDLRGAVGGMDLPTLVVTGEGSIFPKASREAYAAAIPECRLVVVRGAGHFPHMERPAAFRRAVARFLARLR